MTIQQRHLVDRYLQGELSGIELEDFKNSFNADEEFRHAVDLLKIIYSGILLAREEQLKKKILNSIKYRKPSIPFALKLILTFLIITFSIISLWFYAGKELADTSYQKPWYSFLNKNSKPAQTAEKSKNTSKTKGDQETKSNNPANQTVETSPDSASSEQTQNQTAQQKADEINESANDKIDTAEIKTAEDIVVKQDQLLITASIAVVDKSSEKQSQDNSLTADAAQKLGSSADLPLPEEKAKNYDVEFWVSPINYKGYKMSKNKIILFGIEEPDAVKLYRVNDAIYMTYLKTFYELDSKGDFKPFQKLKETEIPASIK